jgi:hypothetical protein
MSAENPELLKNLKLAKTKRLAFAYVAKGTEGTLLVARKVKPKEIADARKDQGGGTVFKGQCFYEGNTLVFELAQEPPGPLAQQIKRRIKQETGLALQVECRVNQTAEEEPADEAEADAEAPAGAGPASQYEHLRASLTADLGRLRQSDAATADKIQKIADAAAGHAHQGDFARAVSFLDGATKALAEALRAARAAEARAAAPAGQVAAETVRLELQRVRLQTVRGLEEVVAKVRAEPDPRAEQVAAVLRQLAKDMPAEMEYVLRRLDAAAQAGDAAAVRQQKAAVQKSAKDWLTFLQVNGRLIRCCESNPWGVAVAIDQPLRASLVAVLKVTR